MAPVTHSVFEEREEEEQPADDDDGEETAKKSTDILDTFKHCFVSEVVHDERMWFKRVPRLGSFMAVPLVYKSCLFYESLEKAIADYQESSKRRAEQ
jgi:hypothetical protein